MEIQLVLRMANKLTRDWQSAGCVVDQIVHDWENRCVGQPFEQIIVQIQCGHRWHCAEHAIFQQGNFVVLQIKNTQIIQSIKSTLRDTLQAESGKQKKRNGQTDENKHIKIGN